MLRTWELEHYVWHWDGYSISTFDWTPHIFYLHSDVNNRFTMIPSSIDWTWSDTALPVEGWNNFGVFGKGILFRQCVLNEECKQRYIETFRTLLPILEGVDVSNFAGQVSDNIQVSIARDPRREHTIQQVTAITDLKITLMRDRPGHLRTWLANPVFSEWRNAPGTGRATESLDVRVVDDVVEESPLVEETWAPSSRRQQVKSTVRGNRSIVRWSKVKGAQSYVLRTSSGKVLCQTTRAKCSYRSAKLGESRRVYLTAINTRGVQSQKSLRMRLARGVLAVSSMRIVSRS